MWMLLFMALPLAGLGYVSWHIWQLLPTATVWKWVVTGVLITCFLLLFLDLGRKLDRLPLPIAQTMYEIGTSTVIVLLYLVIAFLVLDVGRLFHIVPRSWLHANAVTTVALVGGLLTLFVCANLNYKRKVRVELHLTTAKPLPHDYTIVMLSDLHLGYHNQREEFHRWVDLINAEKPDLILIAGDIIDGSMRPLKDQKMYEEFHRLSAPIYACLGNHEYYSGEPDAQQFYRDANIHLLQDSATVVGDLCIIGRDDRTNIHRKSLGKIMEESSLHTSHSSFLILLDHQPYHLEQAERQHIDFQFSGHTHHGQVWPISWITESIYECAFGAHKRGHTNYYVSSGLGIWGGKFRIGTRSEYVVLNLQR